MTSLVNGSPSPSIIVLDVTSTSSSSSSSQAAFGTLRRVVANGSISSFKKFSKTFAMLSYLTEPENFVVFESAVQSMFKTSS